MTIPPFCYNLAIHNFLRFKEAQVNDNAYLVFDAEDVDQGEDRGGVFFTRRFHGCNGQNHVIMSVREYDNYDTPAENTMPEIVEFSKPCPCDGKTCAEKDSVQHYVGVNSFDYPPDLAEEVSDLFAQYRDFCAVVKDERGVYILSPPYSD